MSNKVIVFGIVLAIIAAGVLFFFLRGGGTDSESAHRLVAGGARLVDVRTAEEFAAGHIDGAVNIPVQELERRMGELAKDTPIVVYCRSGGRSARAARMLQGAGYPAVHDLGAMSRW